MSSKIEAIQFNRAAYIPEKELDRRCLALIRRFNATRADLDQLVGGDLGDAAGFYGRCIEHLEIVRDAAFLFQAVDDLPLMSSNGCCLMAAMYGDIFNTSLHALISGVASRREAVASRSAADKVGQKSEPSPEADSSTHTGNYLELLSGLCELYSEWVDMLSQRTKESHATFCERLSRVEQQQGPPGAGSMLSRVADWQLAPCPRPAFPDRTAHVQALVEAFNKIKSIDPDEWRRLFDCLPAAGISVKVRQILEIDRQALLLLQDRNSDTHKDDLTALTKSTQIVIRRMVRNLEASMQLEAKAPKWDNLQLEHYQQYPRYVELIKSVYDSWRQRPDATADLWLGGPMGGAEIDMYERELHGRSSSFTRKVRRWDPEARMDEVDDTLPSESTSTSTSHVELPTVLGKEPV